MEFDIEVRPIEGLDIYSLTGAHEVSAPCTKVDHLVESTGTTEKPIANATHQPSSIHDGRFSVGTANVGKVFEAGSPLCKWADGVLW
jgi:hypothetical protein